MRLMEKDCVGDVHGVGEIDDDDDGDDGDDDDDNDDDDDVGNVCAVDKACLIDAVDGKRVGGVDNVGGTDVGDDDDDDDDDGVDVDVDLEKMV